MLLSLVLTFCVATTGECFEVEPQSWYVDNSTLTKDVQECSDMLPSYNEEHVSAKCELIIMDSEK